MIRFTIISIVLLSHSVYLIKSDFADTLDFALNEPYALSLIISFIVCVLFRLGTAPLRRVALRAIAIALPASFATAWVAPNFDSPFYELVKTFGAPSTLLSHFIAIGQRPSRQESQEPNDAVPRASPIEKKPLKSRNTNSEDTEQIERKTHRQSSPPTKDTQGFVTFTSAISTHDTDGAHLVSSDHTHIEAALKIPKQGEIIEVRNPKRNEGKLIVAPIATKSEYIADNAFIRDSLRYASAKVKDKPIKIPFQHYWPTFSSLSSGQLQWYLWWRGEWLSGSMEETCTSYLFLLAYELINFTLVPNKQRAFALLKRLHDDFRFIGPIDNHLSRWTADMAWELGFDTEAYELYQAREPEVAQTIGMMLHGQSTLPDIKLDMLINKHRYRSVYFEDNEQELRRLFREAIRDGLDVFKQKGINFYTALGQRPNTSDSVPWKPYSSALVYRRVHFRPLYRAPEPGHIQCMQDFLRSLENLHRELSGVRRSLKVNYLPEDVLNFIEERRHAWKSLPPTDPPKPKTPAAVKDDKQPAPQTDDTVTIDPELLERLKRETEASQRLATVWLDESGSDSEASDQKALTRPFVDPKPSPADESPPAIVSDATDASEQFIHELTPRAHQLLREVRHQKEWIRTEAEQWARSEGIMLTSVLDEVNNPAVEHFDHPLVYIEDGRLCLDEEIMDLLAHHIDMGVTDDEKNSAS